MKDTVLQKTHKTPTSPREGTIKKLETESIYSLWDGARWYGEEDRECQVLRERGQGYLK